MSEEDPNEAGFASQTTPTQYARLPLSRGTAALAAVLNLVVPGLGSLVASRRVGWVQLALPIITWATLLRTEGPVEVLAIAFAVAWLWAFGTTILIVIDAAVEAVRDASPAVGAA